MTTATTISRRYPSCYSSRSPQSFTFIFSFGFVAAILPGDGVLEQVTSQSINSFLQLYNGALIMRLVLTWLPNAPPALVSPLATVCDPYLNLFRGLIPPLGGTLDFSPILAFVVLDVFTNSAAALPCEVNADGSMKARTGLMTKAREAWGAKFERKN